MVLQAIPSKFSCATFQKKPSNTSHFVPLFLAQVGWHPMELVSHGLRKEKGGEECQAIKEHQCAN
jgi:hypothetical protein